METHMIPLQPQPRCGKPFQIGFVNRGPEYWYNERVAWRTRTTGPMLISWMCPYGTNGEPKLIDGTWYWVETKNHGG